MLNVPVRQNSSDTDLVLPGPTGESNVLSTHACGRVLVIADNAAGCISLCETALSAECAVLAVCSEPLDYAFAERYVKSASLSIVHAQFDINTIVKLQNIDAVAVAGSSEYAIEIRQAMASRAGRILPLITHSGDSARFCIERHVCIDTTAAGGNATLLASAE